MHIKAKRRQDFSYRQFVMVLSALMFAAVKPG
jgi:hypothetical protein